MNKKTNLTSDNSSFLRSVSNETKEHFDSLLKKALHKNDKLKTDVNNVNRNIKKLDKTKSAGKEINSRTGSNYYVDTDQSSRTENFMLEKFLIDAVNSKKEINNPPEQKAPESTRKLLNSVTFIKPPVPLPRTATNKDRSSTSPLSRQGTYSISSPILRNSDLLKDIEKLSSCSRNTYDVTDPKVFDSPKDDNHSVSSCGTYNIYRADNKKPNTRTNSIEFSEIYVNDSVGDVIVHNNSPISNTRIVKIIDNNKRQISNNTSKASARGSKIQYIDTNSGNDIKTSARSSRIHNKETNIGSDKKISARGSRIPCIETNTGSEIKTSARSSRIHYDGSKSIQLKEKFEKNKNNVENVQIEKHSFIEEPNETNTGSETKTSARSSKIHYDSNKSIPRNEESEKVKNNVENLQIEKHSYIEEPKETNIDSEIKTSARSSISHYKGTNTGSEIKTLSKSSKIHYESEKLKERKEKSEKDTNRLEKENKSETNDPKNIELVEFNSETISKFKKDKRKITEKNTIDDAESSFKEPLFTYKDLIGVIVYRTDKLLLNSVINHPCVKIHVVDIETGQYLTRSKEIEKSDMAHKIKHIYPLITKSYNLQQNRSLIPYWEELIIFTEDFDYMLEYKESVIIFFEVLDFLSFSAASGKYNKEGSNSGWHKIAWAFLKLVSKTGELNTEQKIRLQLYKPKKISIKQSSTECILHDWWSKGSLTKYPSTLHVSIKRVKADSLKETNHSDAVFKSELGLSIIEKDKTRRDEEQDNTANVEIPQIKWSRMPNQTCKIPNKVQAQLKSGRKGCFALKFSNNGLLLACGIADGEKYAILIYSVLNKQQEYCKFAGHQGIIYHLCWSSDDKYLISSSADCTVYIWNVSKKHFYPKQVLPHPAFVYCAQLNQERLQIMTGCYDQVLRIWKSSAIESDYELIQELDGHTGYITSLCFGENKDILYSADSVGIIIEWNYNNKEWFLKRTLKFKDFDKTVINNIMLHPGANRMLVFCRDSTHRMIDLSVGCIVQWYRGALNYRVHTNGYLSPCGSLVFAPSEDGSIFVWNTDTGSLLTVYNPYNKIAKEIIVPHCIHYHPLDNIVAISHYGSGVPIFICIFDNLATEGELHFKNCSEVTEKQNVQERKSKQESRKVEKPSIKKHTTGNKNLSFDVIIDKIDDVLVSAKTD